MRIYKKKKKENADFSLNSKIIYKVFADLLSVAKGIRLKRHQESLLVPLVQYFHIPTTNERVKSSARPKVLMFALGLESTD